MKTANISKLIHKIIKLAQKVSDIEITLPYIDLSTVSDDGWERAEFGNYAVVENVCDAAVMAVSKEILEQTAHISDELMAIAQEMRLLKNRAIRADSKLRRKIPGQKRKRTT